MDFLNDLGKKFTQAARSVQAFTRESTESTRLSSALRDARDELDSLYAELGRACYEQHTRPESEIPADLFDRVRAPLRRPAGPIPPGAAPLRPTVPSGAG